MDGGDRILVAAGLTAAVVVGAFVLWGPGGAPKVRRRRGQIAGLHNLGRTCFLNTLLQALAASPHFIQWLKKYAKPDSNNSMMTTLYTVIEVVNGSHAAARGGAAVCPLGVLQALRAAGWVLPPAQHDAHELLHALLACLDDELAHQARKPGCLSDALGLGETAAWSALASPSSPPARRASRGDSAPRTPSAPPHAAPAAAPPRPASAAPPPRPDLDAGEPDLTEDPEPVVRLPRKGVSRSFCHLASAGRRWAVDWARAPPAPPYRGSLASRLQCTVCGNKTPVRYDKFDSVSLSLSSASVGPNGSYTLTGLLRALTAPELVADVQCAACAAPAHHLRTTSFGKLPQCLWLHVSRVEWRGCGAVKRAEHVAFPAALCLAPYAAPQPPQSELTALLKAPNLRSGLASLAATTAPGTAGGGAVDVPSRDAQYRLVAAVVHVGGPRSGHFATYRRGNGFEVNRWWYTSDTLVHEVTLQEVLRCSAYMLFYEKIAADEPLTRSQF